MSRSIKKGPYVAPELLKRVEAMNEKGEKKVVRKAERKAEKERFKSYMNVVKVLHLLRTL